MKLEENSRPAALASIPFQLYQLFTYGIETQVRIADKYFHNLLFALLKAFQG